jgi:hypothetical protein
MKRHALILALLPSLALAQVTDKPPPCAPNAASVVTLVDWDLWRAWPCRPADRTMRYWPWFYTVNSLAAPVKGLGAAITAAERGDPLAPAMFAALRTDNLDSPRFGAGYKQARALAAKQPMIPVNADIVTGKTCACDVSHVDNGYLWRCPIEGARTMADCKPL